MFTLFGQLGVAFCAWLDRCSCANSEVKQFVRSGAAEQIIELSQKCPDLAKLHKAESPALLRFRLVWVVLSTGSIEVLSTSLLDTAAFPAAVFGAIYHARWRIKEAFKTLKCRQHLGGFTGELPCAIEQEIDAKILVANITAALCTLAHARLEADKPEHYRINQTVAIKHWSALAVAWIIDSTAPLQRKLDDLIKILTVGINELRPDRSRSRSFKVHGAWRPHRACQ